MSNPRSLATFLSLFLGFYNYVPVDSQYGGARDRVRSSPTRDYVPVKVHPCEQSSCYPATGNLLIGREKQLYASSTCGVYEQQRYCTVSHLEERKKCFWCDAKPSRDPKSQLSHNISNIVYRYYSGTRNKSWWQSENGKENVTIRLDLEAEFKFTHVIITFKTFRPAAMLVERSYDFGKTWQIHRYFAYNCNESFPGVPISPENVKNLTDAACEVRYSKVAPSTDGEVVYRVLPPWMHIDNPYSQEVQNLLKMTNLRINFTKLHTLEDDLLDKREEIQEKYYYAISDMIVRGSCSCYGHANRCLPLPGMEPKPDMVHGRCECTHNTKGSNCEECEDIFNDLPWRPAIGNQTNACKRCHCNNHATSCHFDPAVYEQTGRVSGGVCDGCRHNTMGPKCEQCKPFYYRDSLRDIQDPEICRPCDCDPHGSLDGGICDSITDFINGLEAGRCHCKTNAEGRRCDTCKNGFWNFNANNPDGCQPCTCSTLGTIDNQGCNVYNGECTCKRYVTGQDCNQCLPEYWGLSEKKDGCQHCHCDPGGSYDNNCDVVGGQCRCREHMMGRRCEIPQQQHVTASLDFLLYEAELARTSATCQVVIREPYRDGRENTWTGTGFVKAPEGGFVEFIIDDIKTTMEYDIVVRYEPVLAENWDEVTITIIRPNPVDHNGPCASAHPSDDVKRVSLPSNSRSVSVFPPSCLEAGLVYKVRLDFNNYIYNTATPSASVLIDSIVLVPRIEAIPWFNGSAPGQYNRHHCYISAFTNNKEAVFEVCKKYYNSIGAYGFNGALYGLEFPNTTMDLLLRTAIIFMLLKNAHSTSCEISGDQLICKQVTLEAGKPLATNVEYFRVTNIQFTDSDVPIIPSGVFANFKNVVQIWLNDCKIRSVETGAFNGLPSLKMIRLENNALVEIKPDLFNDLQNLEELSLFGNKIAEIKPGTFNSLPNLKMLRLHFNAIPDLQSDLFNQLPNLETLALCDNIMVELRPGMFNGLKNLEELSVCASNLSEIKPGTFDPLIKLKRLFLYNDKISEIKAGVLTPLTNLQILSIYNNQLTEIRAGTMNSLTNLKGLYLNNNKISKIQAGSFSGMKNLEDLWLESNQITQIQMGTFNELSNLQELHLHFNRIEELTPGVFNGLPNLRKLSLCDNYLKELRSRLFAGLAALEELSICASNLTEIEPGALDSMTSLKRLYLYTNKKLHKIKVGVLSPLTSLDTLSMFESEITSIEAGVLKSLNNLKAFYVNSNKIRVISKRAFENLANLETVHASHNLISHLNVGTFINVPKLRDLNLEYNLLINIDCEVFASISNLEYLNLSHNKLTVIPANCADISIKLKGFYINHNALTFFDTPFFLFRHPNLKSINLNNNAWKCNTLEKSTELLNQYHVDISDKDTKSTENFQGIACSTNQLETENSAELFEEIRLFSVYN